LKRMRRREVGEVINEPECARCNQNEADDGHGEWTFIHKYSAQCKLPDAIISIFDHDRQKERLCRRFWSAEGRRCLMAPKCVSYP
jgi:hypothetical protein